MRSEGESGRRSELMRSEGESGRRSELMRSEGESGRRSELMRGKGGIREEVRVNERERGNQGGGQS